MSVHYYNYIIMTLISLAVNHRGKGVVITISEMLEAVGNWNDLFANDKEQYYFILYYTILRYGADI